MTKDNTPIEQAREAAEAARVHLSTSKDWSARTWPEQTEQHEHAWAVAETNIAIALALIALVDVLASK